MPPPKILRKMEFTGLATVHQQYICWMAHIWLVREHTRIIDEPSSMAPRWLALPILKCEPLTIHLTDGTWLALREPQPSHPVAGLVVGYGWFSWGHLPENLGWRLRYFGTEYLYLIAVSVYLSTRTGIQGPTRRSLAAHRRHLNQSPTGHILDVSSAAS